MKVRPLICVFCASAKDTPPIYVQRAEEFGRELATGGYDLVWGGCDMASMGAVARGIQAHGGKAIGVIPSYMHERGLAYKDADELIIVRDLSERKFKMNQMSSASVALPGGIGTLDELTSQLADAVIDARRGVRPRKIAILNSEESYADLRRLLETFYFRGLASDSARNLYKFCVDSESVFRYLKS